MAWRRLGGLAAQGATPEAQPGRVQRSPRDRRQRLDEEGVRREHPATITAAGAPVSPFLSDPTDTVASVAITERGDSWFGDDLDDLAAYLLTGVT